jgi:membrane protease YdiL (CAAX protease family)
MVRRGGLLPAPFAQKRTTINGLHSDSTASVCKFQPKAKRHFISTLPIDALLLGMLSGKRWDFLALLRLAMGLFMSLLVGGLLSGGLSYLLPKQPVESRSFYAFVIFTLSFQGVGLVLITQFLKLHEITWKEFLGLDQFPWQRALSIAFLTAIVAIPLTILLNAASAEIINAIQHQKPEEQLTIKLLQQIGGPAQRVFFGFAAIVLAPLVEESLFRGILYRFIKQRGHPKIAFIGVSLLFAAIHANLMTFVPLTVLAMILTLLYERTKMLLTSIVLHALFNAVNFTLVFVLKP